MVFEQKGHTAVDVCLATNWNNAVKFFFGPKDRDNMYALFSIRVDYLLYPFYPSESPFLARKKLPFGRPRKSLSRIVNFILHSPLTL